MSHYIKSLVWVPICSVCPQFISIWWYSDCKNQRPAPRSSPANFILVRVQLAWYSDTQLIRKGFSLRYITLRCDSHPFPPSAESPLRQAQSSERSSLEGVKIVSRTALKVGLLPQPFICVHLGKTYLTFVLYNNFSISKKDCQREFVKTHTTLEF